MDYSVLTVFKLNNLYVSHTESMFIMSNVPQKNLFTAQSISFDTIKSYICYLIDYLLN